MTTDFRALCADLVRVADALDGRTPLTSNQGQALDGYSALAEFRHVADRARAALADELAAGEPASVTGQPSDGELNDTYWAAWHEHLDRTNSVLHSVGLRAVLARWGSCQGILDSSAPAPAGEVGELIGKLVEVVPALAEMGWDQHAQRILRAAELLQRQAPVPVPVSERLPGDQLCWWLEPDEEDDAYGSSWTLLRIRGGTSSYTHWLPAHALPVPGQEVEG